MPKRENPSGAERFRTLRSRLYQIAAVQPVRRILVTSSLPAEDKTFVASNLAQSVARQNDRKVLLVDADLHASRLHLTLGTDNEPGLSDHLMGEKELPDIIQIVRRIIFASSPVVAMSPRRRRYSTARK